MCSYEKRKNYFFKCLGLGFPTGGFGGLCCGAVALGLKVSVGVLRVPKDYACMQLKGKAATPQATSLRILGKHYMKQDQMLSSKH